MPSLREVLAFFRNVFTKGQLETECVIMTLIYIERLIKQTRGRLQIKPSNWKSVLLIGMIMASKVWDDLSMWNADFGHVCPSFTLERINELELAVLDFLKYSVCIGASVSPLSTSTTLSAVPGSARPTAPGTMGEVSGEKAA